MQSQTNQFADIWGRGCIFYTIEFVMQQHSLSGGRLLVPESTQILYNLQAIANFGYHLGLGVVYLPDISRALFGAVIAAYKEVYLRPLPFIFHWKYKRTNLKQNIFVMSSEKVKEIIHLHVMIFRGTYNTLLQSNFSHMQ